MKYAVFDTGGFPLAFYAPDVHGERVLLDEEPNPLIPAEAVDISDEQWTEFLENPGVRRWDGAGVVAYEPPPAPAPIPGSISDRQFAQVLALDDVISKPEALAWAARGELPQKLKDALIQIPEANGQRFGAEMMLSAATMYERDHPLVPTLGALLGYDAAALDEIWTRGAAL